MVACRVYIGLSSCQRGSGCGAVNHTCWARRGDRLTMWRLAGVPGELLDTLKTGHGRDMFQEAWFNLITLHDPDYSRFFSCCSGKHVIADGLMLSFKLSRAHFEHPWQAPGKAAVVYAPSFAERLLMPKVALRKALLQYCGGALEPRELATLEGALGDEGLDCLLFLLERPDIDSSGLCCHTGSLRPR